MSKALIAKEMMELIKRGKIHSTQHEHGTLDLRENKIELKQVNDSFSCCCCCLHLQLRNIFFQKQLLREYTRGKALAIKFNEIFAIKKIVRSTTHLTCSLSPEKHTRTKWSKKKIHTALMEEIVFPSFNYYSHFNT